MTPFHTRVPSAKESASLRARRVLTESRKKKRKTTKINVCVRNKVLLKKRKDNVPQIYNWKKTPFKKKERFNERHSGRRRRLDQQRRTRGSRATRGHLLRTRGGAMGARPETDRRLSGHRATSKRPTLPLVHRCCCCCCCCCSCGFSLIFSLKMLPRCHRGAVWVNRLWDRPTGDGTIEGTVKVKILQKRSVWIGPTGPHAAPQGRGWEGCEGRGGSIVSEEALLCQRRHYCVRGGSIVTEEALLCQRRHYCVRGGTIVSEEALLF